MDAAERAGHTQVGQPVPQSYRHQGHRAAESNLKDSATSRTVPPQGQSNLKDKAASRTEQPPGQSNPEDSAIQGQSNLNDRATLRTQQPKGQSNLKDSTFQGQSNLNDRSTLRTEQPKGQSNLKDRATSSTVQLIAKSAEGETHPSRGACHGPTDHKDTEQPYGQSCLNEN